MGQTAAPVCPNLEKTMVGLKSYSSLSKKTANITQIYSKEANKVIILNNFQEKTIYMFILLFSKPVKFFKGFIEETLNITSFLQFSGKSHVQAKAIILCSYSHGMTSRSLGWDSLCKL